MNRTPIRMAALVLALGAAACGKKPQAAPVAPQPASQAPSNGDAQRREAEERARREAEEARRREEIARAQALLATPVYFDYDSFEIRADSRAQLDQKIPLLRSNPSVQLRVAGHTDERGSVEYNVALGMRRAQAVREYLAGFGLAAARFEPISYGEEQPAVEGTGESAWSRNRRAEFQVTGGSVAPR